jgi:hypothetical protein
MVHSILRITSKEAHATISLVPTKRKVENLENKELIGLKLHCGNFYGLFN